MHKYEIIRLIGDGTYGIVYEGKNKETKEKVAIKKLKQKYQTLEECKNTIEIKILEKLNHDNLIKLKEVIRDYNGDISYIFEYCDCNLLEFINSHKEKNKNIPEPIIREIILQLTNGLKYLHSRNFFHRDLKPENVLLILNKYDLNNISKNNINSGIRVKLADFGTAKRIPTKDDITITEYVCTRWYRSPECVLRTDYYNETSDIWALGCIMAELYKLEPIFPGESEFDQINQIFKILGTPTKGKWPWGYSQAKSLGITFPVYYKKDFKIILKYIEKDGVNLLNDIFQFELSKRPSCIKILNHPYFKLIPRPLITKIPYSIRNSFPTTNKYNSSYSKENNHQVYNRIKYELNNTKNKTIIHSYYDNKTYNTVKKDSDNKIPKQNSEAKNFNFKFNSYFNSSENNIRNSDKKNKISNCFKVMINSNRKNTIYNNFKYLTINETKNSTETKRGIKYFRNIEMSKMNKNNKAKKDYINLSLTNQGRNIENYLPINNYTNRNSFLKISIEDKYNINSNINKRLNNNNYLTLNDNNKNKKFNKNFIKSIKNLNIINNSNSTNDNINYMYPNNINTSKIINTESSNYTRKKFDNYYKANLSKVNNNINNSNKRNKQRKNYKFSEIYYNIKNKYKTCIKNSLKINKEDKNKNRYTCSSRRNFIDDKSYLKNNNIIIYKSIKNSI